MRTTNIGGRRSEFFGQKAEHVRSFAAANLATNDRNLLNLYVQRAVPGAVDILGLAVPATPVTVKARAPTAWGSTFTWRCPYPDGTLQNLSQHEGTSSDLASARKSPRQKLALAARLRQETTLSVKAMAEP